MTRVRRSILVRQLRSLADDFEPLEIVALYDDIISGVAVADLLNDAAAAIEEMTEDD